MTSQRNKYVIDLQHNVQELQKQHNELTNRVISQAIRIQALEGTTKPTAPSVIASPSVAPPNNRGPPTVVATMTNAKTSELQQAIDQSQKIQLQQVEQLRELQHQLNEKQHSEQLLSLQRQLNEKTQAEQLHKLQLQLAQQQELPPVTPKAGPKKGRKPRKQVIVVETVKDEDEATDE
jgi:hypothetical protein